jgi:hypothetical protein
MEECENASIIGCLRDCLIEHHMSQVFAPTSTTGAALLRI